MSAATSQSQSSNSAATFAPSTTTTSSTAKKLFQVKLSGGQLHASSSPSHLAPTVDASAGLTDQDIDDIVVFLLEKLNEYSDQLNQLSTAKEMVEKELKCLNRCLLRQGSKIKNAYGNRTLAVVEIYFEKMLRLCMRELELQHFHELKSDVEDELRIAGSTIEQFDQDLEPDIWWRSENLHHDEDPKGQLSQNLEPPPFLVLRSHSNKIVQVEVLSKMRQKLRDTSEQLCSVIDKIRLMQFRQSQDRANFDRFCQLKQSDLRRVMPFCSGLIDTRMHLLMLKPKLDKLSTKIDRMRRSYAVTMNDLYMVSCYIRQFRPAKQNKSLDLEEAYKHEIGGDEHRYPLDTDSEATQH